MASRTQHLVVVMVMALVVAACGVPATAPPGDVASQESGPVIPTATLDASATAVHAERKKVADSQKAPGGVEEKTDFECPVTIPTQPGFVATRPEKAVYSEQFPEPDLWPSAYPHEGMVWYGSEELWTALAVDGDHGGRKSVWWSVNFAGGIEEDQPEVSVTWTHLDTNHPVVVDNGGKATNAFTRAEGWFMIAGIDPNEAGCWEVEASYKGATLSYVYEKPGGGESARSTQADVNKATGKDACPVTMPGKGSFTPVSERPVGPPPLYDAIWYGTPELYTMINPDGMSTENRWLGGEKTFWWSESFSVTEEPKPAIEVTARRLDGTATYEATQTTHGMRDDIGNFMLVGITLPEPGCWELTAAYRGASLSYVIWVEPTG